MTMETSVSGVESGPSCGCDGDCAGLLLAAFGTGSETVSETLGLRPESTRRRKGPGQLSRADRAALDVALELGIPHGGWCPRGRRAEDGRIPDRYQLVETDSADYRERTLLNVEASDATLVITMSGGLQGGTGLTWRHAWKRFKPRLHVVLGPFGDGRGVDDERHVERTRHWLETSRIAVLNVAGPRESNWCIHDVARAFLLDVLR